MSAEQATLAGKSPLRRMMRRVTSHLAAGSRIRDYTVIRLIGDGGFGQVYEVEHATLGVRRALKVLHARHASSRETRERFAREARMIAAFDHPSIVKIYEYGETTGPMPVPFFVMELLSGQTLQAELVRRGRYSLETARALLAPICDALAIAHRAGLVHRDIKPENIFLHADGRVVLLDFGIAKPLHLPALTRSNQQIGTPIVMAPEQLKGGEVDRRTDVYQLGMLLFTMLTGRSAFHDAELHVVHQRHLEAPRERVTRYAPELPGALDAVIARAMAISPSDRFADVDELFAAVSMTAGGGAETRPTLGVYVELDGELDAVERALTACCTALTAQHLTIAWQTENAALFAGIAGATIDRAAVEAALGDDTLELSIAFHLDDAVWVDGQVVDGPLLELGWLDLHSH